MHILLLSTQLLSVSVIKKLLKAIDITITIYEHPGFYMINKVPVSATKKKYFKQCLSDYVKQNKCTVVQSLNKLKQPEYHYFEFLDLEIEKLILTGKKTMFIKHHNPMFLLSEEQRTFWIKNHKTFTFNVFYKYHREALDIFPRPIGGKWTYDEDNQNSLPKNVYDALPEVKEISFPTDRISSIKWLKKFIKTKLDMFGPYQDTITDKNLILWHAGISPMLNMGLLLPSEVIKVIPNASKWTKTVISSYEGFLRQLFWREYMCMIYRAEVPIKNIFKSNVKLNKSWYERTSGNNIDITGIELIDQKIVQSIKYGYLHHIERLMLVGNIMLLLQIRPQDVYTWFMCNFVDAHHWVMVGNVYHMLLFASGRIMTQRPYIASSTYLKRQAHMSDSDCNRYDVYYAKFILGNLGILKHTYMISGHIKRAKMLKSSMKL
jgi:deoxyribodipyrimidine photolyase-related protein